jgi:hypothetical protein
VNSIICEGKALLVDVATYLQLPIPAEKDYEYVISLHDEGADISFYEELGPTKYVVHTESFKFGQEIPMTAHMQMTFLSFFEEAYWHDKVDIRKAVRVAVNETMTYFRS